METFAILLYELLGTICQFIVPVGDTGFRSAFLFRVDVIQSSLRPGYLDKLVFGQFTYFCTPGGITRNNSTVQFVHFSTEQLVWWQLHRYLAGRLESGTGKGHSKTQILVSGDNSYMTGHP